MNIKFKTAVIPTRKEMASIGLNDFMILRMGTFHRSLALGS
jgi:hypothetical protein